MVEIQEFEFTETAGRLSTSVATTTLYQILLGRDPENSHVIEESKSQPIEALFRSFVRSAEFSEYVIVPLQRDARLRHEFTARAPNPAHLQWLASLLVLSPAHRDAIGAARSWSEFFRALLWWVDPIPSAPAATPSVVHLVLEEIAAIELRLDRLKTLVKDVDHQTPTG